MSTKDRKEVFLGTGLQSGGTTLVSWCFLQRSDMDGTLDGDADLIPLLSCGKGTSSYYWYKTTISAFSLEEQVALLQDEGCRVRPLLIVRDVRMAWASLMRKPYGCNGVTAEDPPLRQRFRRFLRSWRHACEEGIPVLKFERFLQEPKPELQRLCQALELPWQRAMLEWPDPDKEIADGRHGNARFRDSDKSGLAAALDTEALNGPVASIHEEDLAWLDETFADFNRALGYPQALDVATLPGRLTPGWEVSRRFKWRMQQKPLRYVAHKLGLSRYRPLPH